MPIGIYDYQIAEKNEIHFTGEYVLQMLHENKVTEEEIETRTLHERIHKPVCYEHRIIVRRGIY